MKGDKQCLKILDLLASSQFLAKFLSVSFIIGYSPLLLNNKLISPNQLEFRPGDSCVNQLFAITPEICKSFDDGVEVRGVFLDIAKEEPKEEYGMRDHFSNYFKMASLETF